MANLSRRSFLQLSGLTLSATVLGQSIKKTSNADRPNVVFILADDLGKGMLSRFGQSHFTTPNIDKLFSLGADFTFAHSCMYCAPARAALLTGYHDAHTKNKWRISPAGEAHEKVNQLDIRLANNDPYLAQVFKTAGYTTAQIGKLEYGFQVTQEQMAADGWDAYYGYFDHVACHGYYPTFLWEKTPTTEAKKVALPGNTHANAGKSEENESYIKRIHRWTMTGKTTYAPDLFLAHAKNFIQAQSHSSTPFFLYYSTNLPHGPVQVPASKRKYTGAQATKDTYWPDIHPEILQKNKRLSYWDDATGKPITPIPDSKSEGLTDLEMEYATMVKRLDFEVGEILKVLNATGLLKNTLVIFAADNGHELYTQQFYGNRCLKGKFADYSDHFNDVFNGNNSMRGLKWNNYQGGINIPFAIYWPNHVKPNTTVKDLIALYDLLPSFADLFHQSLQMKKDGTSIFPLLKGNHFQPDRAMVAMGNGAATLVTNEGWKLRGKELFYLPEDPQERHNIAAEHPDRVEKMSQRLKTLR